MTRRRHWRWAAAAAIAILLAGCGRKSSTAPSDNTGNTGNTGNAATCGGVAVSVLGCPRGMVTGTIGGAAFNGGVPDGGALYTQVPARPALGLPAQDFILVQGISADQTTLTITVKAKVGFASLGEGVIDPETNTVSANRASLTTVASGAPSGAWHTFVTGGSGSITISSVSTSGASGSFSLTMVPQAGTGAVGNRFVTGSFNVTF